MVEESAKSFATYFSIPLALVFSLPLHMLNCPRSWRHTSAIRLMFSFRSFSENPRSLFSPKRTLSPSNLYAATPVCRRCCSSAVATVDFPDAERPVNQIVKPRCLRNSLRSWREREGCQVMLLLKQLVMWFCEDGGVDGGVLALPFLLLVTARTLLVIKIREILRDSRR